MTEDDIFRRNHGSPEPGIRRNRRTASAARMRNRRSCAGFLGSAQPTEERGSAPGRGSPDRANAHKNHLEISGSGPTGSPERLPLLIWNSPEPAAGLAFGKAASRPVHPLGLAPERVLNRSGVQQVVSLLRFTT